jgi:hypothetical protein
MLAISLNPPNLWRQALRGFCGGDRSASSAGWISDRAA